MKAATNGLAKAGTDEVANDDTGGWVYDTTEGVEIICCFTGVEEKLYIIDPFENILGVDGDITDDLAETTEGYRKFVLEAKGDAIAEKIGERLAFSSFG